MPASAKVGYARVSSEDQNLERQKEIFAKFELDRVFEDKASGKDTDRSGFRDMMKFVRDGDHLYVVSMDRLARNLKDLLSITETLQARGVCVHFLKEKISLDPNGEESPISKLLMAMMGAVAEFERSLIKERQAEGIALAKKRGVYKGRMPISPAIIAKAKERIALGVPIARVAKDLKVGRTTLYKYLKA